MNRDKFLDIKGIVTGQPMNKKRTISFIIAILCVVLGALLPLDNYGPKCGIALGLVIATIVLWVSNTVHVLVPGLIITGVSVVLGIITLGDVQTTLGTSAVYTLMGLSILSMGAEYSNVGKRIAYWLLYKLGKKPSLILLSFVIAGAVISAFVSNIATTLMLAGIAIGVLNAMGEEPGKSGFGRALMLICAVSTCVGGIALINGCPAINANGLAILSNAVNMTISYADWAKFGIPCALLAIIPCWLLYSKFSGFKPSDIANSIDTEYFHNKLKELGGIGGSEIRWVLTVAIMIFCLLKGIFALPVAALIFGLITVLPVVGTVKVEDAFRKAPWVPIIMCGMVPLYGTIFTATGISTALGALITPWLSKLPLFLIILVPALLMAIMNNVFVNAGGGVLAICVGATAPVILSVGLNPAIILVPTMFLGSFTIAFGTHIQMTLTYGYNYWDMKDCIAPGLILCIICAFLFSLAVLVLTPLLGMSFYI